MRIKASDSEIWNGRQTDEIEYLYQLVKREDINDLDDSYTSAYGLLGYSCDEGVRRNMGRVGAIDGPDYIRKKLSRLAIPNMKSPELIDFGNVLCTDGEMESCQEVFGDSIFKMLEKKIRPIGLGGGHDIAYGHYLGIHQYLSIYDPDAILGIINFDTHFDLRPIQERPNSGTPFRQILEESETVNYWVLGIQQNFNTKNLFDYADQHSNIQYSMHSECYPDNYKLNSRLRNQLEKYLSKVDYCYLSVDLDCFSSELVSGVSAPSPLGWNPEALLDALSLINDSGKLISFDIAEMNPKYDQNEQTALLAALIISSLF